jgi:hypothetical protein
MLVALIIAAMVAAYFGWSTPKADGKTIISVVGTVPAALPSFHIPEIDFQWVSHLFASAMAISFLGLLERTFHPQVGIGRIAFHRGCQTNRLEAPQLCDPSVTLRWDTRLRHGLRGDIDQH